MPYPSDSARPAWVAYVSAFRKAFPKLAATFGAASIFTIAYYEAMQGVLAALDRVHGDLSGGERRFQAALARVRLDSPIGPIRLDRNRQAIAPNYLLQYQKGPGGKLVLRTIRVVPNVEQSFGGYFRTNGPLPSRTHPPCKHGNPPPWTR